MHLGAAMVVAAGADGARGKGKPGAIPEEPPSAPAYKSKVQHVIDGKFLKTMASRSKSEVSVQAENLGVIRKARAQLFGLHPLLSEQPEDWNNIPICVSDAIINIIKTVIQGDESLFEYQLKANDRSYRL